MIENSYFKRNCYIENLVIRSSYFLYTYTIVVIYSLVFVFYVILYPLRAMALAKNNF